jgi:hypothetical protein
MKRALFWEKNARANPMHGTSGAPLNIKNAADIMKDAWNHIQSSDKGMV